MCLSSSARGSGRGKRRARKRSAWGKVWQDIYAQTLVGDGGCDDNEGCPIEVKQGDESSFVARLGEHEGSSESCVGNTKSQSIAGRRLVK